MNIPFPLVQGKRRERNNSDGKRDEFQPRPRFPRVFYSFAAFTMDGFGSAIPQRRSIRILDREALGELAEGD